MVNTKGEKIQASIVTREGDNKVSSNLLTTLDSFVDFAAKKELLAGDIYAESITRATEVLKGTDGVRRLQTIDVDGGYKMTIAVGDLHGRRDYVANTLKREITINGIREPVFNHLVSGRCNIVFLGDGIHSENLRDWSVYGVEETGPELLRLENTLIQVAVNMTAMQDGLTVDEVSKLTSEQKSVMVANQWGAIKSSTDFDIAKIVSDWEKLTEENEKKVKEKELSSSLGTMKMVADLITLAPKSVVFLRGNHDDIDGRTGAKMEKGGVPQTENFGKWVGEYFGPEFVEKYASLESHVSILAKSGVTVFSHSLPGKVLEVGDINSRRREAVVALNSTENRAGSGADLTKLAQIAAEMRKRLEVNRDALWVVGHRPVADDEKYRSQDNGKVLQLNDAKRQLIAAIPGFPLEGNFDPKKLVIDLLE